MTIRKMKQKPDGAWAVKLKLWPGIYYFGWSKLYLKGYAAPLNAKLGPLLFATETEAEIAREAYLDMAANPFEASIVQVKKAPTHRLTDEGFAPRPLEEEFALFRNQP